MIAVVQRVLSAQVEVEGKVVGRCGRGLVALIAATKEDTPDDARTLADRIVGLRIFNDSAGKMNLALHELERTDDAPEVLAVSNFTVAGDAWSGRRPSFTRAAGFEVGRDLFDQCVEAMREAGRSVETGEFGAMMKVALVNDGPVTLIVDTTERRNK